MATNKRSNNGDADGRKMQLAKKRKPDVKTSQSASSSSNFTTPKQELIAKQLQSVVASVADAPDEQLEVLSGVLHAIYKHVAATATQAVRLADEEQILEPLWRLVHLPAVADRPRYVEDILDHFARIINNADCTTAMAPRFDLWLMRIMGEMKKGWLLPAMRLINRIHRRWISSASKSHIIDDLSTLLVESLTVYMEDASSRTDESSAPRQPDSATSHAEHIQRRLDCLKYLIEKAFQPLDLNGLQAIWSCLVSNNPGAAAADDRDRCFRFFTGALWFAPPAEEWFEFTLLLEHPELMASEAGVACVRFYMERNGSYMGLFADVRKRAEHFLQLVLRAQAERSSEIDDDAEDEATTEEATTGAAADANDEKMKPTQNHANTAANNSPAVPEPAGQAPDAVVGGAARETPPLSQQFEHYLAILNAELEAMPPARAVDLMRSILAKLLQE